MKRLEKHSALLQTDQGIAQDNRNVLYDYELELRARPGMYKAHSAFVGNAVRGVLAYPGAGSSEEWFINWDGNGTVSRFRPSFTPINPVASAFPSWPAFRVPPFTRRRPPRPPKGGGPLPWPPPINPPKPVNAGRWNLAIAPPANISEAQLGTLKYTLTDGNGDPAWEAIGQAIVSQAKVGNEDWGAPKWLVVSGLSDTEVGWSGSTTDAGMRAIDITVDGGETVTFAGQAYDFQRNDYASDVASDTSNIMAFLGVLTLPKDSATKQQVSSGATMPAGTYWLEYVAGAVDYDGGSGSPPAQFYIHAPWTVAFCGYQSGPHVVHSGGTEEDCPGNTTAYTTAALCEAGNAGAAGTFTTTAAGVIELYTKDCNYGDNTGNDYQYRVLGPTV